MTKEERDLVLDILDKIQFDNGMKIANLKSKGLITQAKLYIEEGRKIQTAMRITTSAHHKINS